MRSLVIEGGRPLHGAIRISGAKNAALPACIAALLTDEPVILRAVPQLLDVSTILYTLSSLGKRVVRNEDSVSVASGGELLPVANAYSVRQMRASFLVLGPLVARLGEAVVPLPGGCAIGARPVDLHLAGLQALGVKVRQHGGTIHAAVDRLQGGTVNLPFPSVGATEQVMMAACLAEGETRILNASVEPEVLDLVALLQAMGAKISVAERTICVHGVRSMMGCDHTLIPDRMEAGTMLLAGAITRGKVTVTPVREEHMEAFLTVLHRAGADVEATDQAITVGATTGLAGLRLETSPYPGFPTDLHPQLAACLALARGESSIHETVFEKRFAYASRLQAMGARLVQQGRTISIHGVGRLTGACVDAPDIRGGAALVLAGLAADGQTTVTGLEHLDRGHEQLVDKLQGLGAHIERRDDPRE